MTDDYVREAMPLILKALRDIRRAAEVAGGQVSYEPSDRDPLERLSRLIELHNDG